MIILFINFKQYRIKLENYLNVNYCKTFEHQRCIIIAKLIVLQIFQYIIDLSVQ